MFKKIELINWVAFSAIHFVVLGVAFSYSFSTGMSRFDAGGDEGVLEWITSKATVVLMSPGYLLWTSWASKHLHDSVEWFLVLLNTLLCDYPPVFVPG